MIVSNLGAILMIWANVIVTDDSLPEQKKLTFCYVQFLAGLMRDGCFNIAHWVFAFEYYNSAVAMPFIFTREEMPSEKRSSMEVLFFTIFLLNVVDPLIYYCVLFYGNYTNIKTGISPI